MIQSLNTDTDDLTDPTKRRAKDILDGVEEEEVSLCSSTRISDSWHYDPSTDDESKLLVNGHCFSSFIFNFLGVISSLEEENFLICARPLKLIKVYCLFFFFFEGRFH